MRINYRLLALVIIASIVFCHVTADSQDVVSKDTKNQVKNDDGKERIDSVEKAKGIKVTTGDTNAALDTKAGGSKKKKANGSEQKDVQENKRLDSEQKKEQQKERLPPSREKCDPMLDSCMNLNKTWIACLRVPGNDSPALSLFIQNKGKGLRSFNISAPNTVELEQNGIVLPENQDTEVKVSISGLESGQVIALIADQGNCSLNFTNQYLALKKVDHSTDSSHASVSKLTLSTGFLVFAILVVAAVASIFLYPKLRKKYFPGVSPIPKYQKVEAAELPISRGSKLENEGWNDSWSDNWDDEEAAPLTPSMPITPSLSSKGMASRKFNKDAWND